MTKFLHLIIIINFIPTYLFSETVTIYATQSAQYSANDCCTLNILTNQNSNTLTSQDCQDMGAYYGCGMSKQVPFWIFDLSTLESSIDIQSIQFKGNLPTENWSDVYLSVSTTVGQISTNIASDLWNGGDWASGNGQHSSINWPIGDFSQNIPLEIFLQGVLSGQLNILSYTSNPWTIFSIVNSGDNAPRLVIDYEDIFEQVDYETQIQTIFNNNCTSCHINGGAYYGGLDLSSYDSLMAGSNNGAVVVSSDHANSLLWQKVNSGEMPPQNNPNLTNDEISLIAQWIDEGALLITTYEGPVWHVSTTGSDSTGDGSEENPFATIQKGIDTASEGDTVLVSAGTYYENIVWPEMDGISLVGNNAEDCIIDGSDTARVIDIWVLGTLITELTVIENFTIQNGNAGIYFGGGIRIGNSNARINNLIVRNNDANYGAGIACSGCHGIFSNIELEDNIASSTGGGIGIFFNSSTNNFQPIFTDVNFTNNSANMNNGGGAYLEKSATFINCSFINNTSLQGGALYITNGSEILIKETSIISNSATATGNYIISGGIYIAAGSASLRNTIVWGNTPYNLQFNEVGPDSFFISYSDIQGGIEEIEIQGNNQYLEWDETNINSNPLFCNPDSGDYTLAENSPCVGSGENGANIGALGVGCGIQVDWDFSLSEPVIEVLGTDNEWNPGDTISVKIDFCNNTDVAHNWYPGVTIESDSSLTSLHSGHIWFYAMFADTCHAISWGAIANTSIISDTVVTFSAYPEALNCQNQPEYCIDGDTLTFEVPIVVQIVATEPEYFIPEVFTLHQNYPNPFNPITTLQYDLPEDVLVNITIYDIMGRVVKTMVNSQQNAGFKSVRWNAANNRGQPVSAGLYLYTIQAGEFKQTKKMLLLK